MRAGLVESTTGAVAVGAGGSRWPAALCGANLCFHRRSVDLFGATRGRVGPSSRPPKMARACSSGRRSGRAPYAFARSHRLSLRAASRNPCPRQVSLFGRHAEPTMPRSLLLIASLRLSGFRRLAHGRGRHRRFEQQGPHQREAASPVSSTRAPVPDLSAPVARLAPPPVSVPCRSPSSMLENDDSAAGCLMDRWGRLTSVWGSQWRPAAFVGSIAHRQAA